METKLVSAKTRVLRVVTKNFITTGITRDTPHITTKTLIEMQMQYERRKSPGAIVKKTEYLVENGKLHFTLTLTTEDGVSA